jgi:hypothetical protein
VGACSSSKVGGGSGRIVAISHMPPETVEIGVRDDSGRRRRRERRTQVEVGLLQTGAENPPATATDRRPRRYGFFPADPGRLLALVEAGAWILVTADSLLGNHGPVPQASAGAFLREYPDAVLATDTHNLRCCSGLSAGYVSVRERTGGAERSRCPPLPLRPT